jgi:hypothetical protein
MTPGAQARAVTASSQRRSSGAWARRLELRLTQARRGAAWFLAFAAVILAVAGCSARGPAGALVVTQTPAVAGPTNRADDLLDLRYPAGSRLVLVRPPFRPDDTRLLSRGLVAAGGPVICPGGKRVFFVGKAAKGGTWQVYQAKLGGGRPELLTAMVGGAMDPAIIATGELVFSSPVPGVPGREAATPGQATRAPSALYVQGADRKPRRLTFGAEAAVAPTVLRDGRILFVSARSSSGARGTPQLGLFTVNNDGTEVTAFALDHDGAPRVERPREFADGRIGFLAAAAGAPPGGCWAECVQRSRPFASRTNLFAFPPASCRSVEPDGEGGLLACLRVPSPAGRGMPGSFAVYRVGAAAAEPGEPLFDEPGWDEVEAAALSERPTPAGHVSTIVPGKKTGLILCLNANFSRRAGDTSKAAATAERVRVLAGQGPGAECSLGEVPLQADGSFMAEVPADTPLGFESVDRDGRVVRRVAPSLWVRPGENRSCIGCHEPYNRSPGNVRPLAAALPPVNLCPPARTLARQAR